MQIAEVHFAKHSNAKHFGAAQSKPTNTKCLWASKSEILTDCDSTQKFLKIRRDVYATIKIQI
jgi:hypothetical protein